MQMPQGVGRKWQGTTDASDGRDTTSNSDSVLLAIALAR
jgi:hypothetical protein